MNGPNFKPVDPSRRFSESELRRLADYASRQITVGGPGAYVDTGFGHVILPPRSAASPRIPARLSGRFTGTGTPPIRYSWVEQQEKVDDPGEWEDKPGGLRGTAEPADQPGFDLNADQDAAAQDFTGQIVWLWPADAGTHWWFEGDVTGAGPTSNVVRHVKCLASPPDSFGRYPGRLMIEEADGVLTDPGALGTLVWLRDANDTPELYVGEIYKAKRTGFAAGRDVYTTQDFNLGILDIRGGQYFQRVAQIDLDPTTNWDVVQISPRRVRLQRLMTVQLISGIPPGTSTLSTGPYIADLRAYPADSWALLRTANPEVSLIARRLDVGRGAQLISQFVWAQRFVPPLNWTVAEVGRGIVEITRELNFNRGGVLVEARVWDVNFAPASNWLMVGDGVGRVVVQRVFDVALGWAGSAIVTSSFTWRQDFGPTIGHWTIREAAAGHVEISRVLDVRSNSGTIGSDAAINDIRLVPPATGANQSWEVTIVGQYRAEVRRRFIVTHNFAGIFNDVWRVRFVDTAPLYADWTISEEQDGAVVVSLAGATVDVPVYRYACVNNELVQFTGTMRFQRGSLKLWVPYV